MLRIEMLPAAHGDCLWVEYGTGDAVHRILIDGGPAHTYPALRERILHLPATSRRFDALVVTHIDADHIEGIVRLLQDAETLRCEFDCIWFNGWKQLNQVPDAAGEPLGAVQGEYLSLLIGDYEDRLGRRVWNKHFEGGPIMTAPGAETLPTIDLPGDCRLTLLSPDPDRLLALKDKWETELRAARLVQGDEHSLRRKLAGNRSLRPLGDVLGASDDPMMDRYELPDPQDRDRSDVEDALGDGSGEPGGDAEFGSDSSIANGSSIALLLEYPRDEPETRLVLTGDAWASVLERSIGLLLARPSDRLALDGFKVPHHGSVGNLTEALLARLSCKNYLVSTSGAKFRHPHARSIELLLSEHKRRGRPCLHFNYLTETTAPWSLPDDQAARGYEATHPKGITLEF